MYTFKGITKCNDTKVTRLKFNCTPLHIIFRYIQKHTQIIIYTFVLQVQYYMDKISYICTMYPTTKDFKKFPTTFRINKPRVCKLRYDTKDSKCYLLQNHNDI